MKNFWRDNFITILGLSFFVNCNSAFNFNGRYYKPINPVFENNEWKVVIKDMNDSLEGTAGVRAVKIRFSFQNKTSKYRMLVLMRGKSTKYNLDFMVNTSNKNGIGDIYKKDPNSVDVEHLYRMEGLSLLLVSKVLDYKDNANHILEKINNDGKLIANCQGSGSGNEARYPSSGSKWLAPNETTEEYLNCFYPQGTYPVKFYSKGDFEIDLHPEIFYHENALNKFEGAL
jgi:hypothetical protein